jgi:hypothetical protein
LKLFKEHFEKFFSPFSLLRLLLFSFSLSSSGGACRRIPLELGFGSSGLGLLGLWCFVSALVFASLSEILLLE